MLTYFLLSSTPPKMIRRKKWIKIWKTGKSNLENGVFNKIWCLNTVSRELIQGWLALDIIAADNGMGACLDIEQMI